MYLMVHDHVVVVVVFEVVVVVVNVVVVVVLAVVVLGSGKHFALDVGHIVGPLKNSRCDTKHRLPCTITPFYKCYNGTSRL